MPDHRPEPIRPTTATGGDVVTEAADGGGRSGMSRRRFLALAGGLGTAGLLGAALGPRAWDGLFGGSPSGAAVPDGRLVLVTLYGGNDGMNTVIPYGNPAYAAVRGPLAVDPSTVLPLGEGFGLHPSMPGCRALWEAGRLAVVEGVGFADPNFSHFASMDIWQSAVPSGSESTGWIGRWLDRTSGGPLRAVGIGPTLPVVLTGDTVQGVTVPAGRLVLPGDPGEQALYAALSGAGLDRTTLLGQAAQSGSELLQVRTSLGPILDRSGATGARGGPPSGGPSAGATQGLAISQGGGGRAGTDVLSVQLSLVANLILAGASSQVYSCELGGFDTHTDQAPTQKALLAEVDTAVSAFVDAMAHDPRGQGTVVVVYTEFGRRVGGNASGGSDHGWANPVLVAGPPVRGGWYGQPPDLTRLADGNAAYTTDFRTVYATLLERVLGVDPGPFLQGSFPTLPFL